MRQLVGSRTTTVVTATAALATAWAALTGSAAASVSHEPHQGFIANVFAAGAGITHRSTTGKLEPVTKPDDITEMDGHVFVVFQNGVGAQGEASPSGNRNTTVVEFDGHGRERAQWDLVGKSDGMVADPATGELIATVNEDANSSIYLIDPQRGGIEHFRYSEALPHQGGTDAVSVYHGRVLVSASAPGTTGAAAPQPTYPALYQVTFDRTDAVATVAPVFSDEARATVANTDSPASGTTVTLGLTDPDSSEVVPAHAPRFSGDFMLDSQGDQQQIYARGIGGALSLSVLNLSTSINDTAWVNGRGGHLLVTDAAADAILAIHGPFQPGQVFVAATPCGSNQAPATCPAPGFPGNFVGMLNAFTGQIRPAPVAGPAVSPEGMIYVH